MFFDHLVLVIQVHFANPLREWEITLGKNSQLSNSQVQGSFSIRFPSGAKNSSPGLSRTPRSSCFRLFSFQIKKVVTRRSGRSNFRSIQKLTPTDRKEGCPDVQTSSGSLYFHVVKVFFRILKNHLILHSKVCCLHEFCIFLKSFQSQILSDLIHHQFPDHWMVTLLYKLVTHYTSPSSHSIHSDFENIQPDKKVWAVVGDWDEGEYANSNMIDQSSFVDSAPIRVT